LSESELELLREAVTLCGRLPRTDDLNCEAIVAALRGDKKRRSGHLQWVLLKGIGNPKIVDEREIHPALIKRSIDAALTRTRK
jgi:3-dehydroquinate synthetase